MTLGEERVRKHPTDNIDSSLIKKLTADLINMCESLKSRDARCAMLAQTVYEEASMWAVKAATTEKDNG